MNPNQDSFPNIAPTQNSTPEPHPAISAVLDYLEHQLPGYRFEHRIDLLFVRELLEDFPDVDILEEIKAFRSLPRQRAPVGGKSPAHCGPALDSQSGPLSLIPLPGRPAAPRTSQEPSYDVR